VVSKTVTGSGGAGGYPVGATGLPAGQPISSPAVGSGTATTAGSSSVTVSVTDGASAPASLSWTVNPAGSCTTAQLVGNAGFENGNAPWSATAGVLVNTPDVIAHTGTKYARLDRCGATQTGTLSQSVTIPPGRSTETLRSGCTSTPHRPRRRPGSTVAMGSAMVAAFANLNRADTHPAFVQRLGIRRAQRYREVDRYRGLVVADILRDR
jgi:hypothetical protein